MRKIIYLFGAGARCNSLPTADGMPKAMGSQYGFIQYNITTNENGNIQTHQPTSEMLEYVEDLKWLMNASKNHASVDTLAKKLSITGNSNDLYKLKNVLSAFLSIEQYLKKIDFRYDAFLASMLNNPHSMPEHISILSWNYDTQIETAFQFYCNQSNVINAQSALGVYQKSDYNRRGAGFSQGFGVFKVNGSSFLCKKNETRLITTYISHNNLNMFDAINEACKNYVHFKHQQSLYMHGLSFAWEPETESSDTFIESRNWEPETASSDTIIEAAKKHVREAEILVIIGYSFPFFNRDIDRQLLGVVGMPFLKKIYFQDPNANEIIESFSSIRNDISANSMIPIFGCKQFFLPYEL